jgi:LysM repeat protein
MNPSVREGEIIMHKKSAALLLAVFLLSLSLSGCFRPASTAPASAQAGTTPTKETAFPLATQQSGNVQTILNQTKTAAALSGTPAVAAQATSTKQPKVVATAKPTKTKKPTAEPKPTEDRSSFQPNLDPERPATYTLKAGEFPICIARRYNLDIISLLNTNNLSMDSQPKAGTKLRIPATGTWTLGSRALRDHPTKYTVVSGDTFYKIACLYGNLLPEDIATKNGMQVGDKLNAGTVLDIP